MSTGQESMMPLLIMSSGAIVAPLARRPLRSAIVATLTVYLGTYPYRIDFAGPDNGLHLLVVIDAFSMWPEINIIRSPTTVAVITFLDELFARFRVPTTIVSDNGTQFATFCKKNEIQHLRISPYHPQSNGKAERFVDTIDVR